MGLANLLTFKGNYDESLKFYDKVLELKPDFVNARICKSLIYTNKKSNPDRAVE